MTETDVAESLTEDGLMQGIEIAERELFQEYDVAYSEWSSKGSGGNVSRVTDLEKSLVSLRVVSELLERIECDDELIQDIATAIDCEDASVEEVERTVRLFEDVNGEL